MFWHGSDHSNTHSVLPRTPNGPNQVVHARKKINTPETCHQCLEFHVYKKVDSATLSWMSKLGRFHRCMHGGRLPPPMPPEPAAPSCPSTNNTTGVRTLCTSLCSEPHSYLLLVTGAVCVERTRSCVQHPTVTTTQQRFW
jgi:hypothetical protein